MTTIQARRATREVAARSHEPARQNKSFAIQDEPFAEHVRSVEPPTATRLGNAEPVVGGDRSSVGWGNDITVEGHGRIRMDQIHVYEVQDGQIVLEQLFDSGGEWAPGDPSPSLDPSKSGRETFP